MERLLQYHRHDVNRMEESIIRTPTHRNPFRRTRLSPQDLSIKKLPSTTYELCLCIMWKSVR
ncbi:hypothetical protein C0J52_27470 [Blattella germanica]|nr:hypothetical protein C0J52_27470 [Blattella germanica]